jgi:hypothetical protein
MFPRQFLDGPCLRGMTLLLLIVVGFSMAAAPAGASMLCEESPFVTKSGMHVPAADFSTEVMGNRARMIQVCCVVVAIGIFVLSRSIK